MHPHHFYRPAGKQRRLKRAPQHSLSDARDRLESPGRLGSFAGRGSFNREEESGESKNEDDPEEEAEDQDGQPEGGKRKKKACGRKKKKPSPPADDEEPPVDGDDTSTPAATPLQTGGEDGFEAISATDAAAGLADPVNTMTTATDPAASGAMIVSDMNLSGSSKDGGNKGGLIGGLVTAAILILLLVGLLVFLRKRQQKRKRPGYIDDDEELTASQGSVDDPSFGNKGTIDEKSISYPTEIDLRRSYVESDSGTRAPVPSMFFAQEELNDAASTVAPSAMFNGRDTLPPLTQIDRPFASTIVAPSTHFGRQVPNSEYRG